MNRQGKKTDKTDRTSGSLYGKAVLVERIGAAGTKKTSYLFRYDPDRHDLSLDSAVEFRKENPKGRKWRQSRVLWRKGESDDRRRGNVPIDAEILAAAEDTFTFTLTVEGTTSK